MSRYTCFQKEIRELSYSGDNSKVLKSSTLWSKYYMLKETLKINNVDFSHTLRFLCYLKYLINLYYASGRLSSPTVK